ncbi:MAG: alanine--tRNA ligase [Melioribacteraceae bacterium]|nr:alanine--tRNA ligase [Melioribacteraceae bacterium]
MTSIEIRNQFFEFFRDKGHKIVPSSPVVPFDDPTLLFANAGMNQFKDVFLGQGSREYNRAADTQKCIRVSGKHNDLEEVGHDTYHHTFFEMLGNWSFGDYYKEEAIVWAWELLTDVWQLPKERLYATVYRTDDEAFEIWKNKTDISQENILRFDEKDNFWEMGDTGPCGPCSEIHINIGDDYKNPKWVNAGSPECIEIWNLVFIQYNKDQDGNLTELPSKHVDTGMGFERICAVLQNKKSNYDTDVFTPILNAIEELSGISYSENNMIPMRVIADHVRTLTFAIADGAVPGNDGRGYVLRRILRRASRYGRKLNLKDPFLYKLVTVVIQHMKNVFPEIEANENNIKKIILGEEESFNKTLDRGLELFDEIALETEKADKKIIDGAAVFKLYDTFGFPFDLTSVMAKERGLTVDEPGFEKLMTEQKERARSATKSKIGGINVVEHLANSSDLADTEFVGYDYNNFEFDSNLLSLGDGYLVLDKTPFYAESGGQIGDTGRIIGSDEEIIITDTQKSGNLFAHKYEGEFKTNLGEKIKAVVDISRRWDIMRNHTATHYLHSALREILGEHVKQSGSYVGPDRLRFDFAHFQKLSVEELIDIEALINDKIRENTPLHHHRNIPFEEAKKMGALMFFGDKYGDKVNVVQFGEFSKEFCGGTHVQNSSEIGLIKIVSEGSVASGIRRIEAVTGIGIQKYIDEQIKKVFQADEKLARLSEEKKKLEKEIAGLKLQDKLGGIDDIINSPEKVGGVNVYKGKVDVSGMEELKSMGDELRNKMKSGVGLLVAEVEEKVQMVCVVTDDLIKDKKLIAGKIVGAAAKIVGGGGGGRPHLATAGGKDVSKIDELLEKFRDLI